MLAAVAATASLSPSIPAFADDAEDRAKARADAVKKSNDLRTVRQYSQALSTVMPYADDNDFDVFIAIGQALAGPAYPPDRKKALEWYNKAVALKPDNVTGLSTRAGVYGDLGYRYDELRLADRRKVVELAEAASPTKTASAGNYADLAAIENTFVVARGGGAIDEARREVSLALRLKAQALDETNYARHLDTAEFINSRYSNNPSMGRDYIDRATYLIKQKDLSLPASWYDLAQFARRVSALPTSMTLAGSTISVNSISTPYRASVAQLRNQAYDNYSRYIDLFESSDRDYKKYGSGVGAYENRATILRAMGGSSVKDAIKDRETLIKIGPMNPGYWRNMAVDLDTIGERTAANTFYEKYLELNGDEDIGDVAATRERLRNT
jgi:tetratricopeptide (TPR) repeat protein